MTLTQSRVLVVDDEESILGVYRELLHHFCDTAAESSSLRAEERLKEEPFDALVTDIRMPDLDGVELARRARRWNPGLAVLFVTGYPCLESAVEGMRLGAVDYLIKPFGVEELQDRVKSLLSRGDPGKARGRRIGDRQESPIVARSPLMKNVLKIADRFAAVEDTVLITGESGTGKDLVAQRIHGRSRRRSGPFTPVNCAAIPDALLESEFFGFEKGAFTGAQSPGVGLLEYTDGGTLFLDEICEMPLPLQGKLLRFLQERTYRRVGGRHEKRLDVRIVAATNRDVEVEVKEHRFREDLYYRLNALQVSIPPLRERPEDVEPLALAFIQEQQAENGGGVKGLHPDALELLRRYPWPGNARDLKNAIRQALVWASPPDLQIKDIPLKVSGYSPVLTQVAAFKGLHELRESHLADFERRYFDGLLRKHGGDVSKVAEESAVSRALVYELLKKYSIKPGEFRG